VKLLSQIAPEGARKTIAPLEGRRARSDRPRRLRHFIHPLSREYLEVRSAALSFVVSPKSAPSNVLAGPLLCIQPNFGNACTCDCLPRLILFLGSDRFRSSGRKRGGPGNCLGVARALSISRARASAKHADVLRSRRAAAGTEQIGPHRGLHSPPKMALGKLVPNKDMLLEDMLSKQRWPNTRDTPPIVRRDV
jgi:hypothetical protein